MSLNPDLSPHGSGRDIHPGLTLGLSPLRLTATLLAAGVPLLLGVIGVLSLLDVGSVVRSTGCSMLGGASGVAFIRIWMHQQRRLSEDLLCTCGDRRHLMLALRWHRVPMRHPLLESRAGRLLEAWPADAVAAVSRTRWPLALRADALRAGMTGSEIRALSAQRLVPDADALRGLIALRADAAHA